MYRFLTYTIHSLILLTTFLKQNFKFTQNQKDIQSTPQILEEDNNLMTQFLRRSEFHSLI